ncbi:hypothetical protein D6C78_02135 [Aureobasidium pullulans]|uniref:Uncharacterized protein n=1 Tax=Aureobasidium pullulans TaxID=5580 RepID=A0A4T0C251_AURPU|nr:hypothetical protein D6C78_02135 [Aureobasidium pullulans]
MGQSMLGWKADDFFVAVKQHLDSIRPGSFGELCMVFGRAAAHVMHVFERLNNDQLSQVLENIHRISGVVSREVQHLDIDRFHETLKVIKKMTGIAVKELEQFNVDHIRDTFKSFQHTTDVATRKLAQVNVNRLHDTLNVTQRMAENITLAVQTVPSVLSMFVLILLFVGFMIALGAFTFIRVLRNLDKRANKMSKDMQALSATSITQGNLNHQRQFAESVYKFIQFRDRLGDLASNQHHIESAVREDHQYIVYQPSSDWHPTFFAKATEGWSQDFFDECKEELLLKRVRLFNNPEAFAAYIRDLNGLDTRSAIHILFPSTHTYDFPITLHIPETAQPVKIVGQTDCSGQPYCRACIIGVDSSDVVDVGLLLEHEAPDHKPSRSVDTKIYPVLWLMIVVLWLGDRLGESIEVAQDITLIAWDYLRGVC